MIGRDCGFFVVADSVSSLRNDWNRAGVQYWARDKKGRDSMTSLTPSRR